MPIYPMSFFRENSQLMYSAQQQGKIMPGNAEISLPHNFDWQGIVPPPSKPDIFNNTMRARPPGTPIGVKKELPLLLKPLLLLKKEGDIGLGDVVERIIGKDNSETFQKWFLEYFGKACGCFKRKQWLNTTFPFS